MITILSGHISEPEAEKIGIDGKINQTKNEKRQLGGERVQIIKQALVERGVAADKIYTLDCADSMLIAPNNIDEGALMNQRIYGAVVEAKEIFANGTYSDTHSLKRYKEVCQQC